MYYLYQLERQYLIEFKGRLQFWRTEKRHAPFCLLPVPIRKEIFLFCCIYLLILTSFHLYPLPVALLCQPDNWFSASSLHQTHDHQHTPPTLLSHQLNLN